ncbi:bifunctional 4-hydroxy-2-oxoglutarate aldolase/2-dehydro-3-deoxy-phosphogluconate aldolase [Entomospira entomophila]|uniref:Bifunctional 4-hydroxy-2-oxoglutarate aldolase/2-dehydro-3-deoxy-phosphogluconate aldolase n=1 Tax=Entomospira entomophila TaxID=2719988 RepID=A0A968GCP6_9SPIO|nr:bifunctional 4-hydroxy-2-oxoglutarate aldolase/2-dehydro-3-deoxy-phosphogluconate aldolase [Entomospira entomophilus]NIZ41021.1 bifunctional 4-hydroxy-2-oxoglutarate aldolase/2-dehydro-3-deoxy-phosphogluconate aldolase [Entomospira entomophilus]WDI35233.1 bifunctional 4-hydroxy-2-oxoglutarate aldolase/2-dehydro-3-deoxy-phosphogluconate aldolase [Entomospira entomophilus]
MDTIMQKIGDAGILPVIKINETKSAVSLAQALQNAKIPIAEVTFRTDNAAECITAIRKAMPSILVGAGTILTEDQVRQAKDAGAQFLVSPGFNPKVVEYALKLNLPITPGVCTPSEMEQASSFGLNILKFFPAELYGGVALLKTLYSVYPHIKFIPTGGISPKNLIDYAKLPNIHAIGGTWIANQDDLEKENWNHIEQLAREAYNLFHNNR